MNSVTDLVTDRHNTYWGREETCIGYLRMKIEQGAYLRSSLYFGECIDVCLRNHIRGERQGIMHGKGNG